MRIGGHNKKKTDMKWLLTLILLVASLSSHAKSEPDVYICLEEHAGGVVYDEGKWKGVSANFDLKFILKIYRDDPSLQAEVFKSGHDSPMYTCPKGAVYEFGGQYCDSAFGQFVYNLENERFIASYLAGYVDGKNKPDNTPGVVIGTCTKI